MFCGAGIFLVFLYFFQNIFWIFATPQPSRKKVHGGLMWLATFHVAHSVTHQQPINIIIIITITIIIITANSSPNMFGLLAFFLSLLNIGHIFALCTRYLVQWPKYLGPSSSNIQYLTSPDQKLSKNIYFMGSEWSIWLSLLDQCCAVSHLPQPILGQNCLTKIGARPAKTSNKLLLGSKNFV